MSQNFLKKTSIRARFAIGLQSLKIHLREENVHWLPELRIVILKYSEFTQSNKLDLWEAEIKAYSPYFKSSEYEIIEYLSSKNSYYGSLTPSEDRENWYRNVAYEIKSSNYYSELIKIYSQLDADLLKNIELCENIARNNLYAGVIGYSEETLFPLLEILDRKSLEGEFDFESISKKYPFREQEGWGKPFDFSVFKRK
jgi:hypothetical protein